MNNTVVINYNVFVISFAERDYVLPLIHHIPIILSNYSYFLNYRLFLFQTKTTQMSGRVGTKCVLINIDGSLEQIELNIKNKQDLIEVLDGEPTYLGTWPNTDFIGLKYTKYFQNRLKNPSKKEKINVIKLPHPFTDEIKGKILLMLMDKDANPRDLSIAKCEEFLKISDSDNGIKEIIVDSDAEMMIDEKKKESNSVYVSNIPFKSTENEVKEFFEKCGIILSLKLPKFQDSGNLLGK